MKFLSKTWTSFLLCLFVGNLYATGLDTKVPNAVLDLTQKGDDLITLKNYSNKPNGEGIFESYTLKLPAFEQAVYYQGAWWPAGGNRAYSHRMVPNKTAGTVDIYDLQASPDGDGGLQIILELTSGKYMAILPLSTSEVYAWFALFGGEHAEAERVHPRANFNRMGTTLGLRFGHHGSAPISGDINILCYATADTPYEASQKVWTRAAKKELSGERFSLRYQKKVPELFNYLGWCSWDCLNMGVNNDNLTEAIQAIEDSSVPIRWMLIDDGHYNKKSLLNDSDDFPNSYSDVISYRSEKIKWFGIWYAMFGNFGGTGENPEWASVKDSYQLNGRRMLPKNDLGKAKEYFRFISREARKHGFDFLKTDFQSDNLQFFSAWDRKVMKPSFKKSSFPNPYEAAANAQRAFHETVSEDFLGLINCNWHNHLSVFNSFGSSIGRNSEDNKGGERDAITHTFHAISSTPWLGQVAWGDHDMFHSGDKSEAAAQFNAVAKAVSGSSIYLSEFAHHIRTKPVNSMCYEDGLLLRPLAPAAPLTDDLFMRMFGNRLFRFSAPLPNKSVTMVVYNMNTKGPALKETFTGTICAQDYAEASGMIQPYPGRWEIPKEGLLAYDWYQQSAQKLTHEINFAFKGFKFAALQLSPIQHGWSVIGRSDKYLSAASVQNINYQANTVSFELIEQGPFALYCENGTPVSKGIDFYTYGDHVFFADLAIKAQPIKLSISRSDKAPQLRERPQDTPEVDHRQADGSGAEDLRKLSQMKQPKVKNYSITNDPAEEETIYSIKMSADKRFILFDGEKYDYVAQTNDMWRLIATLEQDVRKITHITLVRKFKQIAYTVHYEISDGFRKEWTCFGVAKLAPQQAYTDKNPSETGIKTKIQSSAGRLPSSHVYLNKNERITDGGKSKSKDAKISWITPLSSLL